MTVIPVNTFRRSRGGEMALRAARMGGDPVEQQVCNRVGLLLEHPVADAVQGFETVFAGDVATALLNTLLHDRDVAVAPDERRWAGYLVANSPGFSCDSA